MDDIGDYIWQRRIHHGVRYQKSTVPFPESVGIGLEFNAALERKQKLDQHLLTNGVMLELCDFAKTVTKSETYFLFEMLEFNFDLGVDVDNDLQYYEYAKRVHNKIKLLKDQIKLKPHRWKETFPLPDHNAMLGLTGSEQAGRYYPRRNKSVDSSVLTDGSKSSQSSENQKMEGNGAAGSSCFIKRHQGSRLPSDAYPFCKELGVTPTVRLDDTPRRKLDPHLVTNGVMMELLHFSRVLCGTHTSIVHDLVKQNFGLELDKLQFRLHMSKLMEQKYGCLTAEDRAAFRKEPFRVQTKKRQQNRKKRRKSDAYDQEAERLTVAGKRRGTQSDRDDDVKEVWQDGELSYMCPVDFETDVQSGADGKPDEVTLESCLSAETKSAASLDVKQEEEDVFVSPVRTNGHSAGFLRLHPRNSILKAVSDLFSEDKSENVNVQTQKQKLWVRRSTRSKQILKSSRVNDKFAHCREVGLDFNVGSGNKQNVDLQLLTNFVLWEVYKFSNAMTRSSSSFLLEILDNNFNLNLQDELHQRNFIVYIITKEKILQNHPDRHNMEFLHSKFGFPEIYNAGDVTSEFRPGRDAETEQTDWDSPASTTSQQPDAEPHPFCKELGLNLWSAERRPVSQKLDLTVLTKGSVLEIVSFVRELCGAVRETVNDILEHNFDLNLQGGRTEAAEVIQRWYATQKSLMKRQNPSPRINRWLNMVVPLTGHSPCPQPQTAERLKLRDTGHLKLERQMGAFNGSVQQVNNYHICEEIGLVLDVGSKSEAKAKLDLRVLTRGVLCEVHQYVEQNCTQYVPALYKILEYNFDLSSQNHRKVEFAWSIASQVIAMAGKTRRKGDYLSSVFELPFEFSESSQVACKEEPEDFGEADPNDNSDVLFVRELKPVDIEVEVE
uniref:uncharacterized protein LOC124071012 n=1 Tax=Scatophagus argus TaxID=75038 RepID=UPI001ED829B2|nr:uncharacterized protein LOC124071012 [Scatophagus argus]